MELQRSAGGKNMGGVGFNVVVHQNTILITPPIMLEYVLTNATNTGHGKDTLKRNTDKSKVDLQATLDTLARGRERVACSTSPLFNFLEFGIATKRLLVASRPPRSIRLDENSNTHKPSKDTMGFRGLASTFLNTARVKGSFPSTSTC